MKYPEVSKRITLAMNEINIKAVELAEKSGVSKASISQYTNGSHCPSNKKAQQLADVLHVNPLWLMDLDGDKNRKITVDDVILVGPKGNTNHTPVSISNTKNDEESEREKKFVELYSRLKDSEKNLIDNMIATLISKQ